MTESKTPLKEKYPGLVWSNPQASEAVYMRQALLRPRFSQLLSMAADFGFMPLKNEWTILKNAGGIDVEGATPEVERILRNIESGIRMGNK